MPSIWKVAINLETCHQSEKQVHQCMKALWRRSRPEGKNGPVGSRYCLLWQSYNWCFHCNRNLLSVDSETCQCSLTHITDKTVYLSVKSIAIRWLLLLKLSNSKEKNYEERSSTEKLAFVTLPSANMYLHRTVSGNVGTGCKIKIKQV